MTDATEAQKLHKATEPKTIQFLAIVPETYLVTNQGQSVAQP